MKALKHKGVFILIWFRLSKRLASDNSF